MDVATFRVEDGEGFQRWLESQERAVVHFRGMTCPFAQAFHPVFESRAESAPAPCATRQLDLDVDEQWDAHGIEITPTVVLYEKGREARRLEATPHVGLSAEQLDAWLRTIQ